MAFITLSDLPLGALSLSLYILTSSYTSYLSSTPPNPTPYDSKHPDSMSAAVTPRALFIRHSITISLSAYHILLCLTYPNPPQLICPNPANLDPQLFTWTPRTIVLITTILLGSLIRLSAFSALGTNFTFRLAAPKKLITSGMYQYIQHPSYTGKALTLGGNFALMMTPNGAVGCILPEWIVNATLFWRVLHSLYALIALRIAWKRIRDEERMLQGVFGKEWEEWHARTKRLIPGVF